MNSPSAAHDDSQSDELLNILYRITHDLRAPIRGMTEMASIIAADYDAKLDQQGHEYLSMLAECGDKAQKMMHGLVNYVRLAREPKIFDETDLEILWAGCLKKLKPQIESSGAHIKSPTLPVIHGDGVQLEMLFSSLLDNAVKFHDKKTKPEIALSAERTANDYWQFCLRDNGIGIEKQYSESVFELFRRLHTDEEYPGVGMGLSIAKQIIKNHGGRIWCEPATPQGTAFYFTLPATEKT